MKEGLEVCKESKSFVVVKYTVLICILCTCFEGLVQSGVI